MHENALASELGQKFKRRGVHVAWDFPHLQGGVEVTVLALVQGFLFLQWSLHFQNVCVLVHLGVIYTKWRYLFIYLFWFVPILQHEANSNETGDQVSADGRSDSWLSSLIGR